MDQQKTSPERLQKIVASGILADVFEPDAQFDNREAVRQALKVASASGSLTGDGLQKKTVIEVDYAMTLEKMIAAGNYDWINGDFNTEQFSPVGEGRMEYDAKLFHFGHPIYSEAVLDNIKDADSTTVWEPAKIEHLLAFGSKYPDEQKEHPIVGLGSVTNSKLFGQRSVPYLYRRAVGRSLHLDWWSNCWHPFYHFLAIRKRPSPTSRV
jgi:hypothetical protein